MVINDKVLQKLNTENLSIEDYFVLSAKYTKENWLLLYKVKDYSRLISKRYLSEISKQLSTEGRSFMRDILEKPLINSSFEEWWKLYPSTDKTEWYIRTRSLRGNKPRALVQYENATKEVSPEQLEEALTAHVTSLKANSGRSNELSFLPHAERWLREARYLPWISKRDQNKKLPQIDVD